MQLACVCEGNQCRESLGRSARRNGLGRKVRCIPEIGGPTRSDKRGGRIDHYNVEWWTAFTC